MDGIQILFKNETSFLLILVRVLAFFLALPFIGGPSVPSGAKVAFALSIAAILLPIIPAQIAPPSIGFLAIGVLGEVLIGLLIGLGVQLIFAAVGLGAEIAGIQMGFGIGGLFNPDLNQETSVIGDFQGTAALLIFLTINGHHTVLQALVRSFDLVPSLGFYPSKSLLEQLMRLGGGMFALGIKVAIPVTLTLLLANAALGILARVVPQMNIWMFSFPVTVGLGLLVIGASFSLFVGLIQNEVNGLDELLFGILVRMRETGAGLR